MRVFRASMQESKPFQEAVRDALIVVLTSPQFLFLIENSSSPKPERLDEYELASKLSYLLWNGPPDAGLLKSAKGGVLRRSLDREVTRIIEDPRFARFVEEYTRQWLALDKFEVLEPDRARFPQLTRDVRAQLKQEPARWLHYMLRRNLPLRHLIESEYVMVNDAVGSYYGLGDRTESGFDFVAVRHGRSDLGGVLTQAAILAGLSDGRESNPVKRGAWLARKIVGEPPDDPPPNVPALQDDTQALPLRVRLEKHRNQPGCAQCHSKIDPWGVPFEEFDAGGRRKAGEADARSTLPDRTEVAGVNDLKRYLAVERIDAVALNFVRHLATYATGRVPSHAEMAYLTQQLGRFKAEGYRVGDLLRFVVTSPLFLEK